MDQSAYFEQMRQKRKNEILEVARNIILKDGVGTFNIQQIAREADVSTVTLYKYFKNSDEVLMGLIEQIVASDTFFMHYSKFIGEPIQSVRQFHEMLYAEIWKRREDAALLTICEVLLKDKVDDFWKQPVLSNLTNRYEEILTELLKNINESRQLKEDINIQDTIEFIRMIDLSLVHQIGFMNKDEKNNSKRVKDFIERYLDMLMSYLEKSIYQDIK